MRIVLTALFLCVLYSFNTLPAQCASKNGLKNADTRPSVLRLGLHVSGMGTLDPHYASGSQDRAFADMVFNGLLRYTPGEAPSIEPDLATHIPEFKMIGGRQVWTVQLREKVMFHSGPGVKPYELTADDVIFSLQKSADSNRSAYAGEYSNMSVEKTDRYTISIILEKPLSPVLFLPKLTNYAGGFIISKKAIETMGYEEYAQHPIGTGPFHFGYHIPKEKLVLKANDQYFRGKPSLDEVEIHFIPKIQDRESMFLEGKLDVTIGSGAKGWAEKMEKTVDTVIDTFGVGEVSTIYFNTLHKPLDDIRVRKALILAMDREDFLATTSKRVAGGVYSPVPEQFLPGGMTKEQVQKLGLGYAKNINKAKELLSEAGYPDGFSLDLVSSEKRLYRSLYGVLRKELAQIGVICNIEVVSHSAMHKEIRKNPKPIVIYGAWRPNADAYLTRFFHSDSTIVTGARPDTNFSNVNSIDALIEGARLEIYPEKQINLWIQSQIKILNDMVAFPIMYTKQLYLRKSYVDYGHPLHATMALYPQITEKTTFTENN